MQALTPTDPRQAGEFRLSARLGLGGMGRVYLGYSPAGRAVAVKICHPDLAADPSFVHRFAREATAAQAVNGLYTAQVLAAGPYDRPPWMATAFVPGPSLADYVDGFGPLSEPALWRLAAGLAEALLAVHATGLVHRDLKPSNVLLAVDGPRVIDFGIASALEDTALTTTGVLGSPPYMAPEQATGMPAGPASDVFALGSTLAFAAAGVPPFGHGDAPAVLFRVAHMAPALDAVPQRLRGVVAACLTKDPATRPTLPQLLRACRDAAAEGGNSAASFWPGPMTAVIAGYQAGPVSAAPPPPTPPRPAPSGPWDGYHPPTAATSPAGSTRRAPFGRAGTTLVGAVGRRRMLTGLGGLAVAGGLAAAGWELTGSGPGGTAAADATTGTRAAWTHKTGGPVRSDGAISADGTTLYFGSDDGTVYALDAATGKPTSTFPAGGAVSGVALAGDTLLAGNAHGTVHAFPAGSIDISWTSSSAAGAKIAGAPTSGGGLVFAGSDDHYLYALDLDTGDRKWRTPTGGTTVAGAAPGAGVVWAASMDRSLYAIDTSNGAVGWRFPAGGAISAAPLAPLGPVYFGAGNGGLYSVSYPPLGSSSPVNWHFAADGAIGVTPVFTGETLYAATAAGTVYAVGLDTGSQLWSISVGAPVRSGLAVRYGVLYVGCDDGYLYAIDTSTHTVRWRFPAGSAIRTNILVGGGLVYFGSLDHRVYALHA